MRLRAAGAMVLAITGEGMAAGQTAGPSPVDETAPVDDKRSKPAKDRAVRISVIYTSDANADVSGGARRGAAYLQRIGLIGDIDLASLVGWQGARAHVSGHSIVGTGLSASRVGNILTVSGVEATPALRLFNLWIEQKIGERVTVRVGQFNVDQEFAISPVASELVNSTFGWPGSFATNLPSGGPAYPLAGPGIALSVATSSRTTIRFAAFAGDPAGPGSGDPQRRDLHGLNGFGFKGRPFVIGELQHSASGADPAWSFIIGGWVHGDRFDDLRFDRGGLSLADPRSTGTARSHSGNVAIYAIGNARLWRSNARTLTGFARVTASPGDRNAVDLYADAGLALSGPIRARPQDSIAVGVAVARISPRLRGLHEDGCALAGQSCRPVAFEAAVEASYRLQLRERLYVQPNVQWIIHPAAALVSDPATPSVQLGDALVLGIRTSFNL